MIEQVTKRPETCIVKVQSADVVVLVTMKPAIFDKTPIVAHRNTRVQLYDMGLRMETFFFCELGAGFQVILTSLVPRMWVVMIMFFKLEIL